MLIVAGTFQVDPASRAAFLAGREEMMARSRAEPGCITYVYSADPLEPGLVHLFERWESADALAAHLAAMSSHPRPTDGVTVIAREIQQYEIANFGPIGT